MHIYIRKSTFVKTIFNLLTKGLVKMKKIKFLPVILVAFVVSFVFSSCEGLFDNFGAGKGLSGYYSRQPQEGWKGYQFRSVFHFVNNNTVVYYDNVANGRYWQHDGLGDFSAPFPEHIGWYYQDGCGETYTYTKDGDKIYISNGSILTIVDDGKGLVKDGSSYENRFVKWE